MSNLMIVDPNASTRRSELHLSNQEFREISPYDLVDDYRLGILSDVSAIAHRVNTDLYNIGSADNRHIRGNKFAKHIYYCHSVAGIAIPATLFDHSHREVIDLNYQIKKLNQWLINKGLNAKGVENKVPWSRLTLSFMGNRGLGFASRTPSPMSYETMVMLSLYLAEELVRFAFLTNGFDRAVILFASTIANMVAIELQSLTDRDVIPDREIYLQLLSSSCGNLGIELEATEINWVRLWEEEDYTRMSV